MPGLTFHKLDLHTHTPASRCYFDKAEIPEQIINAALAQELAAIAITDHNTAEWIDRMKAAAEGTGLLIFPGVEISMEQYHVVALFDLSATQRDVENFLGALDIKAEEYGRSETICSKSIQEVLAKIHERNGLAILAHIDAPKGAFFEQVKIREDSRPSIPQAVRKLFNEGSYDAVECVEGQLPNGFDRGHQFTRFPPVYQASDNPHPTDQRKHSCSGIGTLYSWFKLDQIDLEGLRQCFADPEVRIRLANEYHPSGCPKILGLQVGNDGFFRNQQFVFHEGLNSIIGGKGVGKSLAIEFLRFALCQPPGDQMLLNDHVGKMDRRLGIGNQLSVVYQTSEGAHYKVERKLVDVRKDGRMVTDEKCTNLDTGETYHGDIPTLLPILAYSQTEVIKIAEDRNAQLQLIDRFIDTRSYEQTISGLRARLEQNDQRLYAAIIARDQLSSIERELGTINTRIASIDRMLNNPVFERMKQAESKKALFDQHYNFVGNLIERVSDWQNGLRTLGLEELSENVAGETDLAQSHEIALQTRAHAIQTQAALVEFLTSQRAQISDIIMVWMPHYDEIAAEHNALLQEMGGNRQAQDRERRRLLEEKAEYERQANMANGLVRNLEGILNERNELLDQLERAYFAYYEARQAKYQHLTELSDGKLRLNLHHAINRTTYENRLVELLRGGAAALSTTDRRRMAQNIMPRRLVQLVLDRNAPHLASEAEISELWADRVIEKLWAANDFTQVLALQHNAFPSDVPSISYRKAENVYAELSELSIGQKCTALLIIALCDGSMPVVIDQPEDALDIASVWEDISKKLRRGKESRQFILTTHNSSVAVGSDSDQFIVMQAGAETGRVSATGAIDRPEVRAAVVQHLEGGNEPYKLRARKYNIQSTQSGT